MRRTVILHSDPALATWMDFAGVLITATPDAGAPNLHGQRLDVWVGGSWVGAYPSRRAAELKVRRLAASE